jgi:hypothetical protein
MFALDNHILQALPIGALLRLVDGQETPEDKRIV